MPSLKSIDRFALAAVFAATIAIPTASFACSARSTRGEPTAKLTMQDGTERRFYTTGPLGTGTCRVDVAGGKILADVQVLTDDVFHTITSGMSAREVMETIGPPADKMRFDNTKTTAWDYHYSDTWGYTSDLSVIFNDAGIVVGKMHTRRDV